MEVTIKINTENAAFSDYGPGNEIARILYSLAPHFQADSSLSMDIFDLNGNLCGSIETTPKRPTLKIKGD